MRRLAAIALLVMVTSLMTSPAYAKDPFKPLVTEQGQQSQTTSDEAQTVTPAPAIKSSASQGSALPLTGIYADLWFGGGMMLIVAGVALLLLERFYRAALDQTRVLLSAQ